MHLSIRHSVLVSLLAFSSMALAGVKTTSVVTTGTGPSEEEATASALAKAVSQVNGTSSSTTVSTGKAVVEGHSKTVDGGKTKTVDASVSAGSTPDVRMRSSGKVSRYDVVSTAQKDGQFTVTVKAYFDKHVAEVYKAPGSGSSKTRIAVFPPGWNEPAYDFFGPISGEGLGDELRDAMERSFVRAGAYSVLDRQTLGSSLIELGLVNTRLTNETEKAKLHNIRGADIIVLPVVQEASHDVLVKTSSITGQSTSRETTHLSVEIRGIVPATGEVIFSELYSIDQATSRRDAVAQVASRSAADLTFKMTGKRVSAEGASAISVAPSRSIEQRDELPPLPPPEQEGTKLPFDR